MEQETIFNPKNLKTMAIIAIGILILSLVFSFFIAPKYKSSVKLLVVFNETNIDAYTASQTSNYLTSVLSEVIYSNSFVDNVFKSNFDLKDTLGFNPEDRQKTWKKMVNVKTLENKGIIFIDVFNSDRSQAEKFAQAISYVLINKNSQYHGSGDKVVVKMIDNPVTTEKLDQPNFAKNGLLGLAAGLVLGLTLIVVFPEQQIFGFAFGQKKFKDQTIDFSKPAEKNQNSENEEIRSINQETENEKPKQYYDW